MKLLWTTGQNATSVAAMRSAQIRGVRRVLAMMEGGWELRLQALLGQSTKPAEDFELQFSAPPRQLRSAGQDEDDLEMGAFYSVVERTGIEPIFQP